MVLSVNKFQNILQKGALDADFSTSSAAGFGMTTRQEMVQPISNFRFHSGVYTAQSLLVVRWQKCADCSSVKPNRVTKRNQEHVKKGLRRHRDPGHCLHGSLERQDKSHGGKHKQGQSAWTESN